MTKNQQGQHYLYAKSKLVYTVEDKNEKKAIEDLEDKETGRMLENYILLCGSLSLNGSRMRSLGTNQNKSK